LINTRPSTATIDEQRRGLSKTTRKKRNGRKQEGKRRKRKKGVGGNRSALRAEDFLSKKINKISLTTQR